MCSTRERYRSIEMLYEIASFPKDIRYGDSIASLKSAVVLLSRNLTDCGISQPENVLVGYLSPIDLYHLPGLHVLSVR
jgi:hypothetical protein